MSLGTEVDLGPGYILLDAAQLPRKGAQQRPLFSAHLYGGQSVAYLSYTAGFLLKHWWRKRRDVLVS